MDEPIDPDFLKRSELFENQSGEVIRAVLAQGQLLEYGPGAVVFRQGDEGDRLYVVKSGVLEVVDHGVDRPALGADRDRVEHQPEEPARLAQRAELVVVEVSRRLVDRAAAAVRAEDRRARRALEQLGEQAVRGVRQVEYHAEGDEVVDEFAAEAREPAAVLGSPVRERVAAVPRQPGHPHAERVEDVGGPRLDAEALDALEREHEADALARLDEVEIGPLEHLHDPILVLAHRSMERRDHRERLAQRPLRLDGDVDGLARMVAPRNEAEQAAIELLLLQRNRNWMPAIKRLLAENREYLIVVGAAHLAGAGSVLDLLQAAGYTVTRIQ